MMERGSALARRGLFLRNASSVYEGWRLLVLTTYLLFCIGRMGGAVIVYSACVSTAVG
jgi:hypothetical protein